MLECGEGNTWTPVIFVSLTNGWMAVNALTVTLLFQFSFGAEHSIRRIINDFLSCWIKRLLLIIAVVMVGSWRHDDVPMLAINPNPNKRCLARNSTPVLEWCPCRSLQRDVRLYLRYCGPCIRLPSLIRCDTHPRCSCAFDWLRKHQERVKIHPISNTQK